MIFNIISPFFVTIVVNLYIFSKKVKVEKEYDSKDKKIETLKDKYSKFIGYLMNFIISNINKNEENYQFMLIQAEEVLSQLSTNNFKEHGSNINKFNLTKQYSKIIKTKDNNLSLEIQLKKYVLPFVDNFINEKSLNKMENILYFQVPQVNEIVATKDTREKSFICKLLIITIIRKEFEIYTNYSKEELDNEYTPKRLFINFFIKNKSFKHLNHI